MGLGRIFRQADCDVSLPELKVQMKVLSPPEYITQVVSMIKPLYDNPGSLSPEGYEPDRESLDAWAAAFPFVNRRDAEQRRHDGSFSWDKVPPGWLHSISQAMLMWPMRAHLVGPRDGPKIEPDLKPDPHSKAERIDKELYLLAAAQEYYNLSPDKELLAHTLPFRLFDPAAHLCLHLIYDKKNALAEKRKRIQNAQERKRIRDAEKRKRIQDAEKRKRIQNAVRECFLSLGKLAAFRPAAESPYTFLCGLIVSHRDLLDPLHLIQVPSTRVRCEEKAKATARAAAKAEAAAKAKAAAKAEAAAKGKSGENSCPLEEESAMAAKQVLQVPAPQPMPQAPESKLPALRPPAPNLPAPKLPALLEHLGFPFNSIRISEESIAALAKKHRVVQVNMMSGVSCFNPPNVREETSPPSQAGPSSLDNVPATPSSTNASGYDTAPSPSPSFVTCLSHDTASPTPTFSPAVHSPVDSRGSPPSPAVSPPTSSYTSSSSSQAHSSPEPDKPRLNPKYQEMEDFGVQWGVTKLMEKMRDEPIGPYWPDMPVHYHMAVLGWGEAGALEQYSEPIYLVTSAPPSQKVKLDVPRQRHWTDHFTPENIKYCKSGGVVQSTNNESSTGSAETRDQDAAAESGQPFNKGKGKAETRPQRQQSRRGGSSRAVQDNVVPKREPEDNSDGNSQDEPSVQMISDHILIDDSTQIKTEFVEFIQVKEEDSSSIGSESSETTPKRGRTPGPSSNAATPPPDKRRKTSPPVSVKLEEEEEDEPALPGPSVARPSPQRGRRTMPPIWCPSVLRRPRADGHTQAEPSRGRRRLSSWEATLGDRLTSPPALDERPIDHVRRLERGSPHFIDDETESRLSQADTLQGEESDFVESGDEWEYQSRGSSLSQDSQDSQGSLGSQGSQDSLDSLDSQDIELPRSPDFSMHARDNSIDTTADRVADMTDADVDVSGEAQRSRTVEQSSTDDDVDMSVSGEVRRPRTVEQSPADTDVDMSGDVQRLPAIEESSDDDDDGEDADDSEDVRQLPTIAGLPNLCEVHRMEAQSIPVGQTASLPRTADGPMVPHREAVQPGTFHPGQQPHPLAVETRPLGVYPGQEQAVAARERLLQAQQTQQTQRQPPHSGGGAGVGSSSLHGHMPSQRQPLAGQKHPRAPEPQIEYSTCRTGFDYSITQAVWPPWAGQHHTAPQAAWPPQGPGSSHPHPQARPPAQGQVQQLSTAQEAPRSQSPGQLRTAQAIALGRAHVLAAEAAAHGINHHNAAAAEAAALHLAHQHSVQARILQEHQNQAAAAHAEAMRAAQLMGAQSQAPQGYWQGAYPPVPGIPSYHHAFPPQIVQTPGGSAQMVHRSVQMHHPGFSQSGPQQLHGPPQQQHNVPQNRRIILPLPRRLAQTSPTAAQTSPTVAQNPPAVAQTSPTAAQTPPTVAQPQNTDPNQSRTAYWSNIMQ